MPGDDIIQRAQQLRAFDLPFDEVPLRATFEHLPTEVIILEPGEKNDGYIRRVLPQTAERLYALTAR